MADARGARGILRLLVCRVGSKLCALPADQVVETMRPLPLEQLANMPSFVCGLSLIRGRPTPVLDGHALLGTREERAPSSRYVTFKLGERPIALLVDAVIGLRDIDSQSLQELPLVLRESQAEQVEALGELDSELLLVLSHTRLLTEEHLSQLEARER